MMNAEVTAREGWAMSPRLRKLALTAHVTFSVGWLGAVAAFLALSIAGQDEPKTPMWSAVPTSP